MFTQHMRDPEVNPMPEGIEGRRIKIYSDLIYNNIQSFIANSFPVIRLLLNDDQWHKLLRDYVKHHQSQTPFFPKMPQEFLKYLESECNDIPEAYPFIPELAHYEWIETSVSLDTRELDTSNINPEGDLLEGIPVLNQLAVLLKYEWPVHQIGPEFIPVEKPEEATYIVVYRKPNDEVAFMALNSVSARLIQKIQDKNGLSGSEILGDISIEMQHPNPDVVIQGGLEIMTDMRNKSILLGVI